MDAILDFHKKKNLVDTPAPTYVKFWLRPYVYTINTRRSYS
jgi:hypothetical protein